MKGRHVVAAVVLVGVATVTGCSADESDADASEHTADSVAPVLIQNGAWTLQAAYIDSKGLDDAERGDRVRVKATVPYSTKGECASSSVRLEDCYKAAVDGQIRAAETRGELPGVGCGEPSQVNHRGIAFVSWCKVGWNGVEKERDYPVYPAAEPIQFDSNGTVWLRIAENGRDASCTVLRLPMTQECVAASPEQVAMLYPRFTDVVGYEQGEGGGWTSGKYLVLRVRGERS